MAFCARGRASRRAVNSKFEKFGAFGCKTHFEWYHLKTNSKIYARKKLDSKNGFFWKFMGQNSKENSIKTRFQRYSSSETNFETQVNVASWILEILKRKKVQSGRKCIEVFKKAAFVDLWATPVDPNSTKSGSKMHKIHEIIAFWATFCWIWVNRCYPKVNKCCFFGKFISFATDFLFISMEYSRNSWI